MFNREEKAQEIKEFILKETKGPSIEKTVEAYTSNLLGQAKATETTT